MTVMSLKKESTIASYFVNKLAKKLFPFFVFASFVCSGILLITIFKFSITNFFIIILSSIGFSYLTTMIIAGIVVYFETSDAMGNNISHIYYRIKNDLEKLKKEEQELEAECPANVLFFPAHINYLSKTDPRKKLANTKTQICLMEMELGLFEY